MPTLQGHQALAAARDHGAVLHFRGRVITTALARALLDADKPDEARDITAAVSSEVFRRVVAGARRASTRRRR